jgi:hypothetical protein
LGEVARASFDCALGSISSMFDLGFAVDTLQRLGAGGC